MTEGLHPFYIIAYSPYIYICTWSAVHLNVPADADSSLSIVARKIMWMMVAILAPEYTATSAFRDWILARELKNFLKPWS
jgi:hypothetical protein